LRPLDVPTAIVWGARDRSHAATDRRSSLALAARAEMHDWPDAGHFPDLEHPARFADLLRKLVRS
jgi:pimeloyl-ACP methyl ester carboxylesterase